jgi:uncharacterized membrane protein
VCFSDKSERLAFANLTNVTKEGFTNETDLLGITPKNVANQFELDIILSAYDENPGQILSHLESCCDATSCRVFVYSSMAKGTRRSHDLENRTREKHELEDWMNTKTRFQKFGARVNNSWTGSEATGFCGTSRTSTIITPRKSRSYMHTSRRGTAGSCATSSQQAFTTRARRMGMLT